MDYFDKNKTRFIIGLGFVIGGLIFALSWYYVSDCETHVTENYPESMTFEEGMTQCLDLKPNVAVGVFLVFAVLGMLTMVQGREK